jgi:hypothetical protein
VGFFLISMIEGEVVADDGYGDGIILLIEAMIFAPLKKGCVLPVSMRSGRRGTEVPAGA